MDSRSGTGSSQDVQASSHNRKQGWIQKFKNQLEEALLTKPGAIWSHKKRNNGNGMKHIKYINIHEFIMTLKQIPHDLLEMLGNQLMI